ncbi:hypothetical protein [Peribacillus frigoritolerans]|uniref:hypothetical protein n=1 Tax=Peribacillus frigoritolerans TaxID=450367 RepID=UPI00105942B6|nr:hypothetical protein [Peribacillus frigoritolerans]TDL76119.1 hypothetical protein E2R53_20665 [Peribacillus frigoritolerans]
MDTALLHGEEINIVYELVKYQRDGYSQQEIKPIFEKQYRAFSKKKAFKCLCCGTNVKIVLPNENKFSFSHFDKRECSYSENYKSYNKHKDKYENETTHDMGKTLIRTFIEGQMKLLYPLQVSLIEGYKYKARLGIVPDFIIELPDGTTWALDFLTGLKTSKQYSEHIEKRKAVYTAQGFKSFFFIDKQWLAYHKSVSPHTTLVEAEEKLLIKTRQDQKWQDEFYSIRSEERNYVQDSMGIRHFSVVSIAYFNPMDSNCTVLRLVKQESGNFDYYVVGNPLTFSIERALTVDLEENLFTLYDENEDDLIKEYQERIVTDYIKHLTILEEKKKEELESQKKKDHLDQFKKNPSSFSEAPPLLKQQAYYNEGINAGYKKQITAHLMKKFGIKDFPFYLEKKEDELNSKREKLLNKSVVGEAYIRNGAGPTWKSIVIDHFFLFLFEKVDIDQLIATIKESGAIFTQEKRSLIEPPIKSFIEVIKKELKIKN